MARFAYGGQALMEGVYMRGKSAIGVAVRGPDGQIFGGQEALDSILHRNRFARAPFFRGVVVLYETLVIGTKWLMRSGSLAAAGEGVAFGGRAVALTLLFTIGLAVGLFVLLPLLVAQGSVSLLFGEVSGGLQAFVVHLLEGVIRVAIFVGYLLLVSRSQEIGRVFQYHGAEHMTIHALEAELPLTVRERAPLPHRPPTLRDGVPGHLHPRQHPALQRPRRRRAVGRHPGPHPAHPGHRGRLLRDPQVGRQAARALRLALALPARHLAAGDHDEAARRLHDRGGHLLHAGGPRGQR